MLAGVVPGIRHLRAPLAAGYLWLVDAWFVFAAHVPREHEATGLLARAYDLVHAASAVGIGVAVSFVAYLIGSVTENWGRAFYSFIAEVIGSYTRFASGLGFSMERAIRGLVVERAVPRVKRLNATGVGLNQIDNETVNEAKEQIDAATQSPSARQQPDLIGATVELLTQSVADEMDLAMTRMIGTEPELHSEVDRLRAESDLRFAILPPLLVLVVVLTAEGSLLWLLTLPLAAVLLWQAVQVRGRADLRLIDAIGLDRTSTPSLERFETEISTAIRGRGVDEPTR